MKLLRSWPATIPRGRAYVQDEMPRLIMDRYDYRVLGDVDDDVLLIEWDIAVGKEQLAEFAHRAKQQSGRILVAPYRLYHYASSKDRAKPLWAHRRYKGDPHTGQLVHVSPDDATCHLFGMGMIYLPRWITDRFLTEWAGTFSDGAFSGWHYHNIEPEVPITWDIQPVHLHYLIDPDNLPQPVSTSNPVPAPARSHDMSSTDPIVAALLRERDALVRNGKHERVAQVDEQLVLRGYKGGAIANPDPDDEPDETPPRNRHVPAKETVEEPTEQPKRRGRPPGSKNRSKEDE